MGYLTFYTQALGSSHIVSGKLCQDNGTHYSKDGVQIAIVCDGHGGESYVRSNVGSRLAAEIAKVKILQFIESMPLELLKGKKGAVTAVATSDPRIDKNGYKKDISMLSESQMELLRQNLLYVKESQKYPEIENRFRTLFKDILESWKRKISEDCSNNPFSKKEKEKIGSLRLEKAYGTTLMAAVKTNDYWFAFHIGDGKLFTCDRLMQWSEPVPWDCNCFLNVTTSLCDYSPVQEFRYAFDGTGDFPLAFVLGSDGIDDTFISKELIHKFYSQLLCVFNERENEEAIGLLKHSLSDLSKRGSHDDMSVAAIIDKNALPKAIEYYKIIAEVRLLNSERNKRQENIDSVLRKIGSLKSELEDKINNRNEMALAIWNWWLKILSEKDDKANLYQNLALNVKETGAQIAKYEEQKTALETDFSKWEERSRQRVGKLKKLASALKEEIYPIPLSSTVEPTNIESSNDKDSVPPIIESLTSANNSNEDVVDEPNVVYEKASKARLSEECIAKMDKESDAQIKEILK